MLYHGIIILAYALTAAVIAIQAPSYVPGLDPVIGYWAGGTFFLLCALVHDFVMRHVERARFQRELMKIRSDLDMAETGLDRFDSILGKLAGKDGNIDSFAAEMHILRRLLRQLSNQEPATNASSAAAPPAEDEEDEIILSSDAEIDPEPAPADAPCSGSYDDGDRLENEILEIVRAGLQENKVDLYLQPIVRLPQRRTQFYEAFSRIRGPRGEVITPGQYLKVAEREGLIGTIDNLLLIRCVQLIRRVRQRNVDIGFFVNISAHTLNDTAFFQQFIEFLDANRDLGRSLILEFAQDDIDNASEAVEAGLDALARIGFTFSVDHVKRLDFDFSALGKRNFRFLKVAAADLLPGRSDDTMYMEPEDLREALLRENIELIASMVEDEDTVIGLLDVEVGFGQGFLFGVPRPPQSVN